MSLVLISMGGGSHPLADLCLWPPVALKHKCTHPHTDTHTFLLSLFLLVTPCGRSALWRAYSADTHRRGRVHHGEVVPIEEGGPEGSHERGHDERAGPVLGREKKESEWDASELEGSPEGNSGGKRSRWV